MNMIMPAEAPALAEDAWGGTVAVLITGDPEDEQAMAAAVAVATRLQARIAVLAIARRVPVGAHLGSWTMTPACSALTLRAEAVGEAAAAARRAVDLIPAEIPAEHHVVERSPVQALERLLAGRLVPNIVVDRRLVRRRPGLRRALRRWTEQRLTLQLV